MNVSLKSNKNYMNFFLFNRERNNKKKNFFNNITVFCLFFFRADIDT